MTTKKYQKRLLFKETKKQNWTKSYWYGCTLGEVPYEISGLISELSKKMASDEIFFKIERREKKE